MRILLLSLTSSLLLAQYRVIAEQRESSKQAIFQVEMLLTPTALRWRYMGTWYEKKASLDFLFTPKQALWVDDSAKVAYELDFPQLDSLPYTAYKKEKEEVLGRSYDTWLFFLPGRSIETVWDTTLSFDWQPWLRYIDPGGMGTPARYFRFGIPLLLRVFDDKKSVLLEFRVLEIQKYNSSAIDLQTSYPVRRLGN
ncbi:MAG: hypothetical protein N2170_05525 [Bacteroidia bacterium]|nr:hypothetical protein [Bacteroidia bacterium]